MFFSRVHFTFFLSVVTQRNVYSVVPLVMKAQSVEHALHLSGTVWAEHIKRLPRLIGHHRVSLGMKKKHLKFKLCIYLNSYCRFREMSKMNIILSSSQRCPALREGPS